MWHDGINTLMLRCLASRLMLFQLACSSAIQFTLNPVDLVVWACHSIGRAPGILAIAGRSS
ncbi:hypothetical protein SynBIOSE41_03729 [Synechococcus sp. BIOS-E4-1]|nr:hypothetical protein SynBIOSE41_03729 [Synechococcus sp. BIOS-E4-1]